MILGGGLLVAVVVLAAGLRVRGRRLKVRWALLALPFAWALFFGVFRGLAHLTQRDLPEPNFTTPPQFYAGVAVPLALAAAALAAGRLRGPAVLLLAGALVVACAAVNYHACFTEDGILLRRCLSFTERRYAYEQVKTLKFVQDQRFAFWDRHQPRFAIGFDDGTRWTTNDGFRRTAAHLDIEAIQRVMTRSHVMLQQVQSWD